MAMDGGLIALLHLCDSLFPIGSFAHSDGLEAAAAAGAVATAHDLRAWLDAMLAGPLRADAVAVKLAMNCCVESDWPELDALDAEVHALRPSAAARHANRAMGTRLLKTWQEIRPAAEIAAVVDRRGDSAISLPIAFAIVCAASRVCGRDAVEAFLYTRLAGSVSAAMRLISVGQTEAHGVLAGVLARVPVAAGEILDSDERPSTFAPALDIAAMSQQYVRSRLFRS